MIKTPTRLSKYINLVCILLVIISITAPHYAQTEKQRKPEPNINSKKVTPAPEGKPETSDLPFDYQRSLSFLDQIFNEAKGLEHPGFKIRVQARAADAIWDFNMPRAKSMFEDSFQSIDSVVKEEIGKYTAQQSRQIKFQLRNELLQLISRHDSALADRLIKSVSDSAQTEESGSSVLGGQSERSSLYFQVGMSQLDSNKQRSLQLMKQGIDSGLAGRQILRALMTMSARDPKLADEMFQYVLLNSKRSPTHPTLLLGHLAAYVFPGFGGMQSQPRGKSVEVDADLASQFLNFAFATIMQQITAPEPREGDMRSSVDHWAAQSLLPYFDRYLPEKAAILRTQVDRIARRVPNEQLQIIDSMIKPTGARELVDRAEKTQGPAKDLIYAQAATMTLQQGDIDEALSIAGKISDKDRMANVKSTILSQGATIAIRNGEFDKASNYAKDVANLQQRVVIFSELASALIDQKKDRQRALEYLRYAEGLISSADRGPDQARALLALAGAVARFDDHQGFEVMKSAIAAVNHIELSIQPNGVLAAATSPSNTTNPVLNIFNFNDSFTILGRINFDLAFQMAQSFNKPEASILSRLAVCRGLLTKPLKEKKEKEEAESKQENEKQSKPPAQNTGPKAKAGSATKTPAKPKS